MEPVRSADSATFDVPSEARWPERLIDLAREYRRARTDETRDAALSEFWVLVHGALCRFLRAHGASDVRDLGAEKAMQLVERMRDRRWEPDNSRPARVHAFVSTVARNALVTLGSVVPQLTEEDAAVATNAKERKTAP